MLDMRNRSAGLAEGQLRSVKSSIRIQAYGQMFRGRTNTGSLHSSATPQSTDRRVAGRLTAAVEEDPPFAKVQGEQPHVHCGQAASVSKLRGSVGSYSEDAKRGTHNSEYARPLPIT